MPSCYVRRREKNARSNKQSSAVVHDRLVYVFQDAQFLLSAKLQKIP
jgi:hypothetical protein